MLNKITKIKFHQDYNSTKYKWISNGYWGNEIYFINNSDSLLLQKTLKIIDKSKHTIGNKDIVYVSRASEIPRFKLKEFIKDNNLKKTSRYGKANTIIINRGYFNDLLKNLVYSEYEFFNGDYVEENYKKWFCGGNWNGSKVLEIIESGADKNYVCLIDHEKHAYQDTMKNLNKNITSLNEYNNNTRKEKGILINLYRETRLRELMEMLVSVSKKIENGTIKIIFDEELFVDLNKEGIELDDEYFQTLRDMLFSSDEANVKLGFEMMSNLVLNQPTLLSIAFLLNELIHTTRFRPSYYSNNNSNLKSLLKLFKTKKIHWDKDWKTFGTGLRLNFKEGKEGEIVKKFLLDNINREFKLNNSAAESLVDIVFATEVNELSLA